MRTHTFRKAAALGILTLLAFGAGNARALLILNSNNVIGGDGAFYDVSYKTGVYNAYHVVDNQTGPINEVVGNYWLGQQRGLSQYFVLDLGATYSILEIDLFNTHNTGYNDRGTVNFHVDAANSVAFVNSTVDYDLVSPVQILSGTLTQRDSANDPIVADVYTSANGLSQGTEYRYLRFTADNFNPNYAGDGGSGLNEIRVLVPEPSTLVLLAFGALWLSHSRQRRRQ